MASRGLWHFMSARTRRSLALSWSALFVLSLLLQYFSFALASPALAVHDEGLFELDGNTVAGDAAPPIGPAEDWDSHPGATGNRFLFNNDPLSQQTDDIFTGGSTKDDLNTSGWKWTTGSVPDKDNIEHAFAASYKKNGHTFVYFGLDRYANNGDAFTGFWFFRGGVGPVAGGSFSGPHQVGDLLVLANFTNGGATASIQLLEWVGAGNGEINGTLHELGSTTQECTNAPAADIACAVTNTSPINPSWTFDDKGTAGANNPIPEDSFFEGGIDLDKLFDGTAPCFGSFLAETRASQSVDAVLKDFSGGAFNTCVPPTIETTSSAATADFGATVHDTATLSGNDGNASGTVKFFICGPNASKPDCSTGGTQVGGAVTVNTAPNPDTATSADFTVGTTAAASGWYCWRAEYTPDANSQYLAGKHTDTNTECFFVAPATIEITKTANPVGPVSAGADIGFDITVHNNGTQTTLGISVSDNLPAGIVWTADPASNGATCSIDTAPNPDVLHCTKASLAADASFTVHIHGTTNAADCGTVSNTAGVATSNDGSDSDGASVVVQCPDIKVTKTPDQGSVDAGGTLTWSIKVENIGAGTATGVTLTDNLPAGIHWTEAENDCSIAGADGSQVLSCTVGTLTSGQSKTYQVSGVTSKDNCGPVTNTASASATNEPSNVLANNSDDGSVSVLCATVTIGKTADHATVSAGSEIGFTLTWGNSTGGKASGVTVTDDLPTTPGLSWSIESFTGTGSTCGIAGSNPQVLTCTGFDIPGNTAVSGTVHVISGTTPASCAVVNNTGHITTTNDGSAQASASVTVQCPDITVVKTPDSGTVNAGSDAVFTIVVSNSSAAGTGTATNVTLTDNLPAGYTWTVGGTNAASCSINTVPNPDVLSCNFGSLAPGASKTITLTAPTTGANCAVIPNLASVAATNEAQGQQGNNSDTGSIDVLCANIGIVKTANPVGPVSAGADIGFDIVVGNTGDGTATNVHVSDNLPAGIVWTADATTGTATATCSINTAPSPDVLSCTAASMAPGTSFTVHIHGTTDAADCGTVSNTASVTSGNDGGGQDDASVVVQCPDLGVVKTGNGPLSAGDTATFTIVLTNHGPGAASGVTLDDQLPSGTWTLGGADAGSCSINGSNLLHCSFGTVPNLGTRTITISKDTVAAECPNIHNDVTVAATNENTATDQFANSDDADITVNCPAISLTKSPDKAVINAGDPIGFTIVVTNSGAGSATGVHVSDNLPAGITWTADAPTGTASASCSINTAPTPDVLTCDAAVMASGSSFSVHIHGATTPVNCGVVDNSAAVTTGNDGGDQDSASVTVQCPDISVVKSPDGGNVNAGDNATFTIVVSNASATGTGTAYDVTLTDNLPAGYTWALGGTNAADCSINTVPSPDVLTCDFGDLAAGASRTVTLTARTSGSSCAPIPNLATVAATNEGSDVLGNNSDNGSINVKCANIAITKVASPVGPVNAGDTVGFDITTTNTGDGIATGVVVTDPLPAGIDWVLGAITGDTAGVACSIDGAAGSEVLTCTDASLAAQGTFSVHVSGATDPADCGTIDNTASVTTGNDGSDEASASVDVLCPDIQVVKDAPNTPIPVGQDLVFTITTTNIGKGTAHDVVLTDTLPAGFDWSVDNTDCAIAAGILTCDFGDLAAGASVKITLTAPTSADPETGNIDCGESLVHQIPNVASASASNEGDDVLGNNSDDATITVLCSALQIEKTFTGNTNGTDPDLGVPSAHIGDTLHFTLHYTGAGPIVDATITDVLPVGLQYVAGTALGNADFNDGTYNAGTRTITWVSKGALPDPASGDVTYDAKVLVTAPDQPQPLVNLATIVGHTPTGSELTDSDTASVAVLAPPLELTPPPTSTITPETGTSNPGFALMLILLGVAGLALGIGFVTPVPQRVRRRNRLG